MDSAGIPWYSTGTVNVTQGSSNVVGVGTNWVNAGLKVGDIFTIDKSRLYQITAINSNTSLSLQEAYQGATGTAQVYFVIRNFAGTMQAQIAAQVSELVNKYESYIDTELKQITGPAGPTSFPYRGTWATGRTYNGLDVVQYGNQLYMALYGHTSTSSNAPGATGTAWTNLLISASGDILTTTFGSGPAFHNSIFRGKNLGNSITSSQWDAINNGTFDELWLGDYWQINNVIWRIADLDYYLNSGDGNGLQTHHALIIPDSTLYSSVMNNSATSDGGYLGSLMFSEGLEEAKSKIKAVFGETHILSHRDIAASEITNGIPSDYAFYDATVDLMTEAMVYGCRFFGAVYNSVSTTIPSIYTLGNSQVSLFRVRHGMTIARNKWHYWLRETASASRFIYVNSFGYPGTQSASTSYGVRPVFAICA